MTRADIETYIEAWASLLLELDSLELRTAVAEARLPGDIEVAQLKRDILERRALVIDSMARLRQAADVLAPATLH